MHKTLPTHEMIDHGVFPKKLIPMSADQARRSIDAIKKRIDDVRSLALELYEREGWRALGYKSWRECIASEFDQSHSYLYRQLNAALIEREIAPPSESHADPEFLPIGKKPRDAIPESQLRPLLELPEGKRKEAWDEAKETAPNGKVTAKHVQDVVDRKNGKPPAGKSIVNGVLENDPPEIAQRRAKGKIAADVIPEVDDPGGDIVEAEPEPPPAKDELSDEEWLTELPIREKLTGAALKWFEIDALLYRTLEDARKTFQHHAARALNAARKKGGNGQYAYYVGRFLRIDHPKHWKVCPAVADGGCGGSGSIGVIGQCPKCKGRGFWIL